MSTPQGSGHHEGGVIGVAVGGAGKLTYSVEEAARLLGIGRSLAYEAVARGELPTIRVGRRLLVPRAALEKMLVEARGKNG